MRATLALGLALASVVVALGLLGVGLFCGARSMEATCEGATCAAPVERCERYVHPMTLPLLAAALGTTFLVHRGQRLGALACGVGAAWTGALFAVSLGSWGVLVAGLALAGAAAMPVPPGREGRALAWTAAAFLLAILPFAALALLLASTPTR